jgi:hypothetical protein
MKVVLNNIIIRNCGVLRQIVFSSLRVRPTALKRHFSYNKNETSIVSMCKMYQ